MKYLIPLAGICLFLFSCQADGEMAEINRMEAQADKDPSVENLRALAKAYRDRMKAHPEDEEWNGRLSYRMAGRYLQMGNNGAAIKTLKDALLDYGGSSASPNSLYLLADTYKTRFRRSNVADTYYQILVEAFPDNEYAKKAQSQIVNAKPLDAHVAELKAGLFADSTQIRLPIREATRLLELYGMYAGIMPKNAKTADYLYEAYNIGSGIGRYREAAEACERLFEEFPEHGKAPSCMFLAAFTYDEELKDYDRAKELYAAFLEKYPDNPLAKSAQVSLENIGVSTEDMLNNIIEKR